MEQHSAGLGLLGAGLNEEGRIITPLVLSSGVSGRGSASLPPVEPHPLHPSWAPGASMDATAAPCGEMPDAFQVRDPPEDLGQALDTPIALATGHAIFEVATGSLGLQAPSCILEGVSSPALRSRGCPPQRLPSPILPVQAQPPGRVGEGRLAFPSGLSVEGENQEARPHQGSGAGLGPRKKPLPAPLCSSPGTPGRGQGGPRSVGRGSVADIPGRGASFPRGSWQAAQLSSTLGLWHPTHAFLLPTPRSNGGALGAPALLSTSSSPSLVGSAILQGQLKRRKDRTMGRAWGLA